MKKHGVFITFQILLCVFSVGISVCDEPEAPPDGMVLIPAGEFEMGSDDAEAAANERANIIKGLLSILAVADEQPVHTVYLNAFYMDKYEVTVGEYKRFVQETGHRAPPAWVSRYSPMDEHPIVGVSWHDAMAYARWAGKRLPTEAEWEKAARGGLSGQTYPWGDAAPNGTQCNLADKHTDYDWSDQTADDGYEYTAPVGRYPANGYGLYDMAGNVWEWCLDEWDSDFYASSPRANPFSGGTITEVISNFTNVTSSRVLRGGSWLMSARYVRVANRGWNSPTSPNNRLGFRCARAVSP